ncbi:MAG: serine/threonine protein kinase [Myxococcales bacterium]|nr:serine/threonine protein kinase [Myxococcales bacterium]
MPQSKSPLGTVLRNRYRVARLLAEGGMGAVYEAMDERTGERVAVKLLHPGLEDDGEWCERFRREAEVGRAIVSPHVARLLEAGKNREGRRWIAFELLDGETLEERLRRAGKLPFSDVTWVIEHALLGLGAAHRLGVVHRDVKPANLLLERARPWLRVLDFGVAKRLVPSGASLTSTDRTLGTPSYMSPEQFEDPRDVDARTDLYSVGLVAYRALTGRFPFQHPDVAAMHDAKRRGGVASLAGASGVTWPDALEGWVQHMVAPRRDDRFSSAQAARRAWERACASMAEHTPLGSSIPEDDTELDPA